MEKPQYRKHQLVGGGSPRLLKSQSRATAAEEAPIKKAKKKQQEAPSQEGGFVRFLPRSASKVEVPRRTRSGSASPSAWALSPGRSSPAPAMKSPAPICEKRVKQSGGGGVGGVLKYFRQKKVSPVLEEEYHQFRVSYNRLMQWRFANARGEASMGAVRRVAQVKVMSRWVRVAAMRRLIVEKRTEMERQKREMKLYEVLKSEMELLDQWRKIESKNVQAVSRVVRKLSAISLSLPLLHDAQADVMSVYDAMSTATDVMDNIQPIILNMHSQVEKTCFLLTELWVMLKQHKQFFQQLENRVTLVSSLQSEEKCLRVHHMQLVKEVSGSPLGPLKPSPKWQQLVKEVNGSPLGPLGPLGPSPKWQQLVRVVNGSPFGPLTPSPERQQPVKEVNGGPLGPLGPSSKWHYAKEMQCHAKPHSCA